MTLKTRQQRHTRPCIVRPVHLEGTALSKVSRWYLDQVARFLSRLGVTVAVAKTGMVAEQAVGSAFRWGMVSDQYE